MRISRDQCSARDGRPYVAGLVDRGRSPDGQRSRGAVTTPCGQLLSSVPVDPARTVRAHLIFFSAKALECVTLAGFTLVNPDGRPTRRACTDRSAHCARTLPRTPTRESMTTAQVQGERRVTEFGPTPGSIDIHGVSTSAGHPACASPSAGAAQGSVAQRRGCAARQDSGCRGLPLAQTTRSVSMRLRWCRASAPADCCPIRPMAIIGQRGGQRPWATRSGRAHLPRQHSCVLMSSVAEALVQR